MEIACPSCGKANQSTPCRRCSCDLSPLFAICQAAEVELALARKRLRFGDVDEARERAANSWKLLHTVEAAQLAFLTCLARNDFTGGRLWHHRAVTPGRQNKGG